MAKIGKKWSGGFMRGCGSNRESFDTAQDK